MVRFVVMGWSLLGLLLSQMGRVCARRMPHVPRAGPDWSIPGGEHAGQAAGQRVVLAAMRVRPFSREVAA